MKKLFSEVLPISLFSLANVLFITSAIRAEPTGFKTAQTNPMSQVTNVSQLSDVAPGDWAFEALRNLVERYGCIEGYPESASAPLRERTFRGNRALTRYEFAAGLNACLEQIERLISASNSNNFNNSNVTRTDLETLQRLIQEFQAELSTLRGRVVQLENRVTSLEANQFSTTTKLSVETVIVATQVFGEENAATGEDIEDEATLGYRIRQSFLTSFNGRDRLRIRLQMGNTFDARGGSNMTNLNTFGTNTNNDVRLNKAEYRFPIADSTMVWIAAHNMNLDDVADALAPFTNSATTGANSGFGAYAPIYYTSYGAGFGISHDFSKKFNLVGYYSAGNARNPSSGSGLFDGQFVGGTQLTYRPSNNAGIGLVYTRSYFPGKDTGFVSGAVGSALADNPFQGNATSTDNFGIVGSWRVTPAFSLEGWAIYTRATAEGGSRDGDTADIRNWKLSFAFPDLFKKGNLGVLTIGNPPQAYRVEGGPEDDETAWFVEAFYNFHVNDFMSITPGFFVITNPEDNRDPLWVGVLRAGFNF